MEKVLYISSQSKFSDEEILHWYGEILKVINSLHINKIAWCDDILEKQTYTYIIQLLLHKYKDTNFRFMFCTTKYKTDLNKDFVENDNCGNYKTGFITYHDLQIEYKAFNSKNLIHDYLKNTHVLLVYIQPTKITHGTS